MKELDLNLRNLVLVLGDQLDESSSAFVGFDPQQDAKHLKSIYLVAKKFV